MKDYYEKSIELHNKLRLNVDEQQYGITTLKQQSGIDYKDEALKITAARTLKKKE